MAKLNIFVSKSELVIMDPDLRQVVRISEEGMIALEELLREWRVHEQKRNEQQRAEMQARAAKEPEGEEAC